MPTYPVPLSLPVHHRTPVFTAFLLQSKSLAELLRCNISVEPIWTPWRESVEVEAEDSAEDLNPSAICAELITGGSKFKIR